MESDAVGMKKYMSPRDEAAMIDEEYERLLAALTEATAIFERHQGGLSSADLRIRSLVRLAERELALAHGKTQSRTHRAEFASDTRAHP